MKKIVLIACISILFITPLSVAMVTPQSLNKNGGMDSPVSSVGFDDLDQFQEVYEQDILLPVGAPPPVQGAQINFSSAQSFIPQKEILSRVELLLARNTTTVYPLTVIIAESLFGSPLTGVQIPPSQVPDQVFEWVTIDFPDITVAIGQTYFIILTSVNVSENYYGWAGNTDSFSYMHGCAWMSIDDGKTWGNSSCNVNSFEFLANIINFGATSMPDLSVCGRENGTWDMCFRTFGRNEAPEVYVTKPLNAVYLANEWLFEFSEIVILGLIRIELEAFDSTGVDRVEFYIDDNYMGESVDEPYYYLWSDREFFKHFVKIIVYDSLGLSTVKEFEVWKFF